MKVQAATSARRNKVTTTLFAGALGIGASLWIAQVGPERAPASDDSSERTKSSLEVHWRGDGEAAGGSSSLELRAVEGKTTSREGTWRSDELWVELAPEASADALARHHGVGLRRAVGPSGLAVLSLPEGAEGEVARRAIRADPNVRSVSRVGAVFGAARRGDKRQEQSFLSELSWHLEAGGLSHGGEDLSDVVVAVLDTGVAYENHRDGDERWRQAKSLSRVSFVAPYDFVNDDAHPNDDHLHGTHVTSLIASEGRLRGAAPGVTIMPVKVLDQDNLGSEADLVDAIYWAVDNGADVINLSLTFASGYVPSAALEGALEEAFAAGIIMVGAAGNDGGEVLYPAASPLVLGVGASTMKNPSGLLTPAYYSNRGSAVDIVAPGGDLDVDANHDDYPDGLIAEGPPSRAGEARYFLYAGTSQAAALVSGAVAQLLAAGFDGYAEVAHALQSSANQQGFQHSFEDGEGGGSLDLEAAMSWTFAEDCPGAEPYYAMVMPYLAEHSSGAAVPTARVTVVTGDGDPAERGLSVLVTARSAYGASTLLCTLDRDGSCEVDLGRDRSLDDSSQLAWSFTVNGLWSESHDWMGRPRRGVFVTDSLVVLSEAMDQQGLLEGSALGVAWSETDDEELGDIKAAYTLVDLGVGLATAPSGLLLTPALLESLASVESVDVDLDGAGLITEPLGLTALSRFSFDGAGLITEPLGFTLYTIDGTGLITEPLGFHALDLFALGGVGLITEPLGFSGELLQLDVGEMSAAPLDGFALGEFVEDGAWRAGDDGQVATWMMGTGAVGFEASVGVDQAAGLASTPVEIVLPHSALSGLEPRGAWRPE